MADNYQTPEQQARANIDKMLEQAGWKVQSKNKIDPGAGSGVAVREYQTDVGGNKSSISFTNEEGEQERDHGLATRTTPAFFVYNIRELVAVSRAGLFGRSSSASLFDILLN